MTIDEAIAKYKKLANNDRTCYPEEAQQLAEWLEELKDYRAKNKMVVRVDVDVDGIKDKIEELSKYAENQYNKAVDDIKEKLMQNGFIYTQHALDVFNEIAEQLKAGGENVQKK